MYHNSTGPGDYESRSSLGRKGMNSLKPNMPSYSFGGRPDLARTRVGYSSKRVSNYFLTDGPSPMSYSPERSHEKMAKSAQKWSIPRGKRFSESVAGDVSEKS